MSSPPIIKKPSKVYISSIQIVQSIQSRLSSSDALSITGTATATEGKGYGVAAIALQHTLSPDHMVTLTTLLGARNRVSVEVVQSLTKETQGMVGLSYGNEGMQMDMKLLKQLSDQLTGSLSVALEKTIECSIDTEYITPTSKWTSSLFVGRDLGASFSLLRTLHKDLGVKGKVNATVSLGDITLETMIGKDLSPFSKINLNVITSLSQVCLKLKYQRGNMNFILPVQLGKNLLDLKAVIVAYGTAALTTLLSYLYHRSFTAQKKRMYVLYEISVKFLWNLLHGLFIE